MRFRRCGREAVLVEVADLDAALALYESVRAAGLPGVLDLVPAARTVLVRLDPGVTSPALVRDRIAGLTVDERRPVDRGAVEIPVRYDGDDLAGVAEHLGVTPDEVVARHTGSPWTAAFAGFAPGFAYLAGGDPRLDVPRLATPRTRIPAGAVALAGGFSAVYPADTPGGWQLIGRTSIRLWDVERDPPALLGPGVRVRFRPVNACG
ncbi:5-oxoprolinase subunit B family protein [Cryptosporangium arvum]|uniref:Allophanate hydrolase subunit 1 n=1 Tax=Cryptosporangium arvum DSM 44712 TaxID=927661 RepID=A0A010YN88_9ACTN|nr:allophanate hydrolase subunit 1 [Cryptosporangium arvum]EXG81655.1 allophanate hydrolase subunit 1 [Cryptosporangium arvum DSM 44712]